MLGFCLINKNLFDMFGILMSLDFLYNYGFEYDCFWIILVLVGYYIFFLFDMGDFNIYLCNKSCVCDFLEVWVGVIFKGKFMGKFCGGILFFFVYVSGCESLFCFVINKCMNNKGFCVMYKVIWSFVGKCIYYYFEL